MAPATAFQVNEIVPPPVGFVSELLVIVGATQATGVGVGVGVGEGVGVGVAEEPQLPAAATAAGA